MRLLHAFSIRALLAGFAASSAIAEAATVELTGPLVLDISSPQGSSLNVNVSTTGSIFLTPG